MGEEVEKSDESLARNRKYLQAFLGILLGFLLEDQYLIGIFVCWSLGCARSLFLGVTEIFCVTV